VFGKGARAHGRALPDDISHTALLTGTVAAVAAVAVAAVAAVVAAVADEQGARTVGSVHDTARG